MKVLGLIGLAGSGKTTYAKRISGNVLSLAEPVKAICSRLVGEDVVKDKDYTINTMTLREQLKSEFEGLGYRVKDLSDSNITFSLEGRTLLQYVGTDHVNHFIGKEAHKSIWKDITARRILQAMYEIPQEKYIVVDDVRFKHELDIFDELVLVVTDGVKPTGHESEKLARKMTKAFRNGTFAKKYPKVGVVYNRRIEGKIYWSDYSFYPIEGELFPDK